jgi:hypothetical protein
MTDWTDGYTAALRDVTKSAIGGGLMTEPLEAMLRDLIADALAIERQQARRRLKPIVEPGA